MVRFIVFAALAAFCTLVYGSPRVRADVDPTVTSCGVFLDTASEVGVPANSSLCDFDMAGVPAGTHVVVMVAKGLWTNPDTGEIVPVQSDPSPPLPVTVPDAPQVPGVLQIVATGTVPLLRSLVVVAEACNVTMDGTKTQVPAAAGLCNYDMTPLAAGTHLTTMTAVNNDPLWGPRESAASALLTIRKTVTPHITLYAGVVTLTCINEKC